MTETFEKTDVDFEGILDSPEIETQWRKQMMNHSKWFHGQEKKLPCAYMNINIIFNIKLKVLIHLVYWRILSL